MKQNDLINDPNYRPNVGIMIVNRHRQILAGEAFYYPGEWLMPQGGIDSGETPGQAMERELTEETGLLLENTNIIYEHGEWLSYRLGRPLEKDGRVYVGQRQKWFLLEFGGGVPDASLTDPREFSHFNWVQPEWLIENTARYKQELYREVISKLQGFFP